MKVISTRLCCVCSTLLLATSLFAQTVSKENNRTNRINATSANYVPYGVGAHTLSADTDTLDTKIYKRKSIPTVGHAQSKPFVKTIKLDGLLSTKDSMARSNIVAKLEKELISESVDTVTIQLYSQVEETLVTEKTPKKTTEVVTSKTLPLSHFQQTKK